LSRRLALAVALALAGGLSLSAPGRRAGAAPDGPASTSAPATPPASAEPTPPRVDVEGAIRRGVAYLVASQNPSGSWGSTASNLWDIYAPPPGSFVTFEVAVTGLAVTALLETGAPGADVAAAVRRGADWLVANHARAKRITADVLYNVWAHAYALQAFCVLLDREKDPARATALRDAAAKAVGFLARFEFVDGGWGYYNFDVTAQRPEHGATSFTTASCLLALAMAKARGVEVPARLVKRGLDLVETLRKPDWSFEYSWDHRFFPQGRVNKTKGSLARTPACMDAMASWDRPVPPERFAQALDDLEKYGHFLLIARKHPIPHETWYQNSGYFCFYGYYHAAAILSRAPEAGRARWKAQIAARLVPLQESDGSWWDYQLYSYHKAYGTS
jgi:hypothetical protein